LPISIFGDLRQFQNVLLKNFGPDVLAKLELAGESSGFLAFRNVLICIKWLVKLEVEGGRVFDRKNLEDTEESWNA
jgi:hypothetical protein